MNDKIIIGCVVVLYNPDYSILHKVLSSAITQTDALFIADNSYKDNSDFLLKNFDSVTYKKMSSNVGIAKAQNTGVLYFMENNFTHVILLDQDSIMAENLVPTLIKDMKSLSKIMQFGGIGPRPINRETNKKYLASINKGNLITTNITEVSELISSGSLIPLKNFSDVGLLENELFIDGVDHEWCWRAREARGLRFFISEEALLSHHLGEGDRFFVVRKVAIPTPFRTYYQFRNYLILFRRSYVPIYWKLSNGFKFLIKFFYFPIFVKPRVDYLKNILNGIKDGILYKKVE